MRGTQVHVAIFFLLVLLFCLTGVILSESLPWYSCSKSYSEYASCIDLVVPKRHNRTLLSSRDNNGNLSSAQQGASLKLHITRLQSRSSRRKNRRQLWLLSDGPGQSSEETFSSQYVYRLFLLLNKKYDIYVMDYRGTGRSGKLKCKGSGATLRTTNRKVFDRCMEQYTKQKINFEEYSTNQVASDVLYAIQQFKQSSNDTVSLVGVGYGSYVINRMLIFSPSVTSLVVVDSVMNPTQYRPYQMDTYVQSVGNLLLKQCEYDASCSKTVSDAFDSVENLSKRVINSLLFRKCMPSYFSLNGVKEYVSKTLSDPKLRPLILPFLYRLARCKDDDRGFLQNLYTSFYRDTVTQDSFYGEGRSFSRDLFIIVSASEFTNYTELNSPHTCASGSDEQQEEAQHDLFDQNRDSIVACSTTLMQTYTYHDNSSIYYPTEYSGSFIMFHSDMNTRTTIGQSQLFYSQFTANDKHLITCDNCGNTIIIGDSCGLEKLAQALSNSTNASLTTKCSLPQFSVTYFTKFEQSGLYWALGLSTGANLYHGGSILGIVSKSVLITFLVSIPFVVLLCVIAVCAFTFFGIALGKYKGVYNKQIDE